MKNLFLAVSLLLISCGAIDKKSNGGASNCSSISVGEDGISIDNHYFMSISNGMVLSIRSQENVGGEKSSSNFEVTPVHPKEDSLKWKITFTGDDFEIFNNTLLASKKVENEEDYFAIYELAEGNKIIEYTYDKFEVLFLDENEKRFMGFYSKNAANVNKADYDFNEKSFGFLNYSNQQGQISKIRIDAVDPMWMDIFDVANPVIEMLPLKGNAIELNSGKTLYFTSSDGKLSDEVNFDIQFTYYTKDTYKPSSFLLEVRGDKIIVPSDFSNTVFNLESL